MGVACLFNWPIPAGKSPTQAADLLHKRIEALKAVKSGTFAVDCETYQTQVRFKVGSNDDPANMLALPVLSLL